MKAALQHIENALAKRFKEESLLSGNEDTAKGCFLVNVSNSGKNIRVHIDCMEGVTTRKCTQLSRYLEEELESKSLVPEDYKLEVSSPGLGNPYKVPNQYRKAMMNDRFLQITLQDDEKLIGQLMQVEDDYIVLEEKPLPSKNKKKKKKGSTTKSDLPLNKLEEENLHIHKLMYAQIKTAIEQVIW